MDGQREQSLLHLARETLRATLIGQPLPDPRVVPTDDEPFGGAFVTLRNHGRLRGCMGRFHPTAPLPETVQKMAVTVLDDPRFRRSRVTVDELSEIDIEISVLSAMTRCDQPETLTPGVHGVYVSQDGRSGCFLPQVASEQGWSAVELLSQCCANKAGLDRDAWRDPACEVHLFTAHLICEKPDPSE